MRTGWPVWAEIPKANYLKCMHGMQVGNFKQNSRDNSGKPVKVTELTSINFCLTFTVSLLSFLL